MKSKRYFNTTGFCMPERHYMIDPLRNQKIIFDLIEKTQYFTIHAPRQTGKTTLLHELAHRLNKEGNYISVVFSVESAGYRSITEEIANKKIINSLYSSSGQYLNKKNCPIPPEKYTKDLTLENYLIDWAISQTKPIVLLLDEIDSLYDDVLVSVLRQLRNGFQIRPKRFPSTVALVGLRDVREYKTKVRPSEVSLGSGSPFNIKAESILLGTFTKEEITELYSQHTKDTGQIFLKEVVDRIYELTGGQPWLVNAIAREIVVKILNEDFTKKITLDHVESAKENIIQRRDTHLDSLIDKLKEERVKNIVSAIINGDGVLFDNYDDSLLYCRDLGIISETKPIRIANEIYREIIPRVLNRNLQDSIEEEGETKWYIKSNGKLDMDKLLKAFQEFYSENSEVWLERFDYKEAGPHLLLMAFLQRVINGGGRINREMAVGTGRTDLLIEFNGDKFVLELKLKRMPSARQKGLDQISRYLDTLGMTKGYLILFEIKPSSIIPWETRVKWEDISHQNKNITIVEM
ncbi:ATPase domain protein, prokaryote domain protein [Candidatus Omnitrophus magneticus]|uniref:ATPase domain protein, prokaryote domain protein n=3 Tax=Candidatus Omnitrophus magneticus TaxID=1609969 RepID=A0A0F0CJQ0_9BACT|nr:ATPase domain protein, prokaryote domain protein [Candidatus Omnitrophus magneticus]KJJ84125.1 ATPase domain protein, prokaryote domain protein [Candidatus Omnitrophus magneticus]KJJ84149.1 ATPase domain protein, prokaryote domain protein [Candidatus Omnitrophus magneticus]KJJ85036.1 ATPase domain protein, prokaryote domain protein [Candidatus Omnitrophus magneticus]KJJ85754.1 ATPase domain protein, prokaryote domain protein [Candidatus Omnitrophus magneticus]